MQDKSEHFDSFKKPFTRFEVHELYILRIPFHKMYIRTGYKVYTSWFTLVVFTNRNRNLIEQETIETLYRGEKNETLVIYLKRFCLKDFKCFFNSSFFNEI